MNVTVTAYDGYYADCVSTAGSMTALTNDNGVMTFLDVAGPGVVKTAIAVQSLPCKDTFTNLPVPYAFGSVADVPAVSGTMSLVMNTITTLTTAMYESGESIADAEAKVKTVFGIPADVDIATFDAIAMAETPAGVKMLEKINQVSAIVVQGAALLDASIGGGQAAAELLFAAIAESVTASSAAAETIDVTDVSTLTSIITTAAAAMSGSGTPISADLTSKIQATAQATSNMNEVIAEQIASGLVGNALVVELSKTTIISQTVMAEATEDLGNGTIDIEAFEEATSEEEIKDTIVLVADQVDTNAIDGVLDKDPVTPTPPAPFFWPFIPPQPLPWWRRYNPFGRNNDWAWGNNKATFLFAGGMVAAFLLIVVVCHYYAKNRHKRSQFVAPAASSSTDAAAKAYEVPADEPEPVVT